jgi:hypothetical protein
MQAKCTVLAKEAQNASSTGQYALNSYAYHPKPLVQTLHRMIGTTVERSRIEQIFVDVKENSDTQDERLMGW